MNGIPSECRCTLSSYNEPLMEDYGSYFSKEEYIPLPLDFVSKDFYFKTVSKNDFKNHYFLILQENSFSCLNNYHACSQHISFISNHKPITSWKHKITNKTKTNHTKPYSLMGLSHRSILGLRTWFFLNGHDLVPPSPWSLASGFNSMVLLL